MIYAAHVRRIAVLCFALAFVGCGRSEPPKPAGPSYAEALQVYNGEVLAMQNLRKEEADTEAVYDAADKAYAALKALVDDMLSPSGSYAKRVVSDSSKLSFSEAAKYQNEEAAKLKKTVTDYQSQIDRDLDVQEKCVAKLKVMRAKMAEQQKRIDRAQAIKDAAEKNRQ